jgi:hypothetical protein
MQSQFMQFSLNKFLIILTIIFLSSCETTPSKYKNICELMDDKISWYKAVKEVERNHGINMETILAFIKQESSFNQYAKPPAKKLFDYIPIGRDSSSYGFSQAKEETWKWYQQKTGKTSAARDNFYDSADFIAWYILQSEKMLGLKTTDVYNQYLAYHEGQGGFKNKTYNQKPWLKNVAKKVANSAKNYQANLKTCRKALDNTYSWSYL